MAGFAGLRAGEPLPAPRKSPAAEAERVDLSSHPAIFPGTPKFLQCRNLSGTSLWPQSPWFVHTHRKDWLSPQNKNHFPVAENRAILLILLSSACCPAGCRPHPGQELTESWRKARAASSPRPESACAAPSQAAGAPVQGVGGARPGPVTIPGLSASSLERPHLNMAGRRLPRYTRVQMRCSLPAAPKTSASDCAALAPLTRFNWAFEAGKTIQFARWARGGFHHPPPRHLFRGRLHPARPGRGRRHCGAGAARPAALGAGPPPPPAPRAGAGKRGDVRYAWRRHSLPLAIRRESRRATTLPGPAYRADTRPLTGLTAARPATKPENANRGDTAGGPTEPGGAGPLPATGRDGGRAATPRPRLGS